MDGRECWKPGGKAVDEAFAYGKGKGIVDSAGNGMLRLPAGRGDGGKYDTRREAVLSVPGRMKGLLDVEFLEEAEREGVTLAISAGVCFRRCNVKLECLAKLLPHTSH